jgi:beta-xylosidase
VNRRRVRVWFGACPIADFTSSDDRAERYEALMRQRFPSLRVTNEPVRAVLAKQ